MKKIKLLLAICVLHLSLNAQDTVSIGKYRKFESKILGGKVTYLEHLPDGYETSNKEYPVIFMMNGHIITSFANASATLDNLSSDRIPDMILIGISNEGLGGIYWSCPDKSGIVRGGEIFHNFLKDELLPEIKKKYRTNGYNILVGQSNTGLYVMYNFLCYPDLFNAYVVASPMFDWCPDFFLDKTKSFIKENAEINKKLYVTYGDIDYVQVLGHINDFKDILKGSPEDLKWKVDLIENTGHVPLITLNNALLFFFSGCTMTPERKKLSIPEIKSHFEKLSNEYGFPVLPKSDALFDIAIDFMYAKKFDQAINMFKYIISLYPNSQTYYYLGVTYQQKGVIELAKESYNESLKIDPNYIQSKNALEQLNKEVKDKP